MFNINRKDIKKKNLLGIIDGIYNDLTKNHGRDIHDGLEMNAEDLKFKTDKQTIYKIQNHLIKSISLMRNFSNRIKKKDAELIFE